MNGASKWVWGISVVSLIAAALIIVQLKESTMPDIHGVQPWHILTAQFAMLATLAEVIRRVAKAGTAFKKSVIDELKVTRLSIKELLGDLAERNPQAMARIIAAMDDQSVLEYVRAKGGQHGPD
jgi:hypothetical protein